MKCSIDILATMYYSPSYKLICHFRTVKLYKCVFTHFTEISESGSKTDSEGEF